MSKPATNTALPNIPCAVPLGFVGSRELTDTPLLDHEQKQFEHELVGYLAERLRRLKSELGLGENHFWCGVSQIAKGADIAFTKACASLPISQRIFLPQPRDEYFSASNKAGEHDFTDGQRNDALKLLEEAHIIQERVVSDSADRQTRFLDVNLEILSVCEVFICLLRRSSKSGKTGGTNEFRDLAAKRGKVVLEIRVAWSNGKLETDEEWSNWPSPTPPAKAWQRPSLPFEIAKAKLAVSNPLIPGVPATLDAYLTALKTVGSGQAWFQKLIFKAEALFIIAAHLAATVCAVIALANSHSHPSYIPKLLIIELILLGFGLSVHWALHHFQGIRIWAMSRLVAEVARSVGAMRHQPVYLGYLFSLPFPPVLRGLLRTVSVLHQATTKQDHKTKPMPWKAARDEYLAKRLNGQIAYYHASSKSAECWRKASLRIFYAGTAAAFAATLTKLLSAHEPWYDSASHVLGALAILLPLLAVGSLSLAAATDLDARTHTYQECLTFLEGIKPLISETDSEREFHKLSLEIESRLLGETANWAARRSFTAVQ